VKKYLGLLIILLTVFSFNMEVDAAKELTCVASSQETDSCLMLKQLSNGDFEMFSGNKKDSSCNNIEWNNKNISSINIRKMLEKNKKEKNFFNSTDNLTKCPTKINSVMDNGSYNYYFKDSDDSYTAAELDANREGLLMEYTVEQLKSIDNGSGGQSNISINGNSSEMVSQKDKLYGKSCNEVSDSDKWLAELGKEYDGACLYQSNTNAGCMVVQLNYSSSGVKAFVYSPKYFSLEHLSGVPDFNDVKSSYQPIISNDMYASFVSNVTKGECYGTIFASGGVSHEDNSTSFSPYYINQDSGEDLWLTDSKGKNFVTGEELKYKDFDDLTFEKNNLLDCDVLFGEESEELKDFVKVLYNLVRILIPVIVIVFSSLDFAKVVLSGSEDDMKKVTQRFIKRLLIAVAIFLVPLVMKFILTIAYNIWGILSPDFCGIL